MNSNATINLLRVLFVVFAVFIGSRVGDTFWEAPFVGMVAGLSFGLTVVLADRLLKGFSLRLFSCATFGLLLGFIASTLLLESGIMRNTSENVQWLISLVVYATFGYIGM